MNSSSNKQTMMVGGLIVLALFLLSAIYVSPTWWVALKAPNYPPEAFPDGVRIHFHMNGVFNGCEKVEKEEISEEEALDCVHEMDTINHYVGMYPIAAGGPVERAYSQFLMVFLGVMLIGFACTRPKTRMVLLGTGFGAILIWMYMTIYGNEGMSYQNEKFIFAMVNSLDQDASDKDSGSVEIDIGSSWVALTRDKVDPDLVLPSELEEKPESEETVDDKTRLLESLKITYEKSGGRNGEVWNGSGFQIMSWHYGKSLGRYFNNQEEIVPMVKTLELAIHLVFAGIAAAMVFLMFAASRANGGIFYWLLILVPMALPLFFMIEYSAWLWWFGHNLNEMGAFTVKPFMPTVFGQGKVAQFSTHSYPSYGFGMMMLTSVVLAVAALIRRRQFKNES